MNPGRYFMPNMGMPRAGINSMIRQNGFVARNGFWAALTSRIKDFNWSGLLNGANKTLNVVNQTIPLIRQTKPMVDNMRNMLSLAKAFKKETVTINTKSGNNTIKKEVIDDSYPNFFI